MSSLSNLKKAYHIFGIHSAYEFECAGAYCEIAGLFTWPNPLEIRVSYAAMPTSTNVLFDKGSGIGLPPSRKSSK